MQIFLRILFFFLLVLVTAFPQDKIQKGVIPEKYKVERLPVNQKSIRDGLIGLNNIETLLLKSENSNLKTILKNQQGEFFKEGEINAKDTKTTIYKTLLGNGFLLIERIDQTWDGYVWVNSDKYSYTYDGNNNQTELLHQTWAGGYVWVNDDRILLSYTPTGIEQYDREVSTYSLSIN